VLAESAVTLMSPLHNFVTAQMWPATLCSSITMFRQLHISEGVSAANLRCCQSFCDRMKSHRVLCRDGGFESVVVPAASANVFLDTFGAGLLLSMIDSSFLQRWERCCGVEDESAKIAVAGFCAMCRTFERD
jgi:hypothetical protein